MKKDIFDGYGIYYFYPINWKYKGKWKNGFPNGYGILFLSKSFKYTGRWNNNKMVKYGWLIKAIIIILYFLAYLYKINNKTIILILIFLLINYY